MPHATATLNGIELASSSTYEVVENNIYFPPNSINKEYFTSTSTSTYCPWKGDASYYTISVDGKEVKDGAWYYPKPLEKATGIKDYVAFYKTKVDVQSDAPLENTITR